MLLIKKTADGNTVFTVETQQTYASFMRLNHAKSQLTRTCFLQKPDSKDENISLTEAATVFFPKSYCQWSFHLPMDYAPGLLQKLKGRTHGITLPK